MSHPPQSDQPQFNSVEEALALHPDAARAKRLRDAEAKAIEEEANRERGLRLQTQQAEVSRKREAEDERRWQALSQKDPLGKYMTLIKYQLEDDPAKQQMVLAYISQTGSTHIEITYENGLVGTSCRFFLPPIIHSIPDMERQLARNGPSEVVIEQGPFKDYVLRAQLGRSWLIFRYARITLSRSRSYCAIM